MTRTLKQALKKTHKNWKKTLDKLADIHLGGRGDCPLCEFYNNECSKCIAQKICNASDGLCSYNNKRTLYGQICDTHNDLMLFIADGLVKLEVIINGL